MDEEKRNDVVENQTPSTELQVSENAMYTPPTTPSEFSLKEVLVEAFDLYKENFGIILAASLVFVVIIAVVGNIPFATLFVMQHLLVGLYLIILKAMRGDEELEFGDLFKGFSIYLPVLIAYIVYVVFVAIGTLLLVIPGIIVHLMYGLVPLLFAEYIMAIQAGKMNSDDIDWWATMQRSAEIMKGYKLKLFLYNLVFGIIAMSGILLLGVGVLITFPFALVAQAVFYRHIAPRLV